MELDTGSREQFSGRNLQCQAIIRSFIRFTWTNRFLFIASSIETSVFVQVKLCNLELCVICVMPTVPIVSPFAPNSGVLLCPLVRKSCGGHL